MTMHRLLSATALAGTICFAVPALAQSNTAPPPAADSQTTNPNVTPEEGKTTDDQGRALGATGEVTEGEDIIVTGSLVPRPQIDGNIPGVQIGGQQIETRGFTNLVDAINDLPLVGPGASPFGTNGGQPASLGASFVDVLDLGTNRTLTLVNGRRFVSGNSATLFVAGNTTGSQVDINSLPAALTSRIDVVTVGGATAYGSDAIAGVVNVVLKTDFEGFTGGAVAGISERGDAAYYRMNVASGINFAEGRGNLAVSLEYNRDDALNGDAREGFLRSYTSPTSFRNGSVRNSSFTPSLSATSTNGAFLPAATDNVPNNIAGTGFLGGTVQYSDNGQIFQVLAAVPTGLNQGIFTANPNTTVGFRPSAAQTLAGNVNLVPGVPVGAGNGCSVTNLTSFCTFAPTGLPGTAGSAAQIAFINAVISRYAPSIGATGQAAERANLATELLKANLPTPREYLARNPGTDINAFIGTFIPAFLDVATTGGQAGALPQTAVPLKFDRAGNVVPYTVAVIGDPLNTPSTTGGAVGGDFYNAARNTTLRAQQDRYIANLFGTFEFSPALRVFTENLYSNTVTVAPINLASRNSVDAGGTENATLIMDLANPYLSTASANTLRAAGVTSKFLLSRTNQDITGDNPAQVRNETYRSLIGASGRFDVFGAAQRYEITGSYARANITGESFQIKDIEYALAIDAVRDASGNIVCRAQTNPAAAIGQTPFGVAGAELVRERGADGVLTERLVRRTATAAQVNACQPLNVFGFGNLSPQAREYVLARTGFTNKGEQYNARATLGGELFKLPGGALGYGIAGEYRKETLDYRADALSRAGATRTAALAATQGEIQAYEIGGELAIPIFGEDFKLPLLHSLTLTPGVRFSKQDGSAPDVRLLNGSLLNQQTNSDWATIYSLGGDWRPIPDIRFRGNYTRSIRQPSVVELFLGGQPSFTAPTDPCSPAQIRAGTRPDTRQANCRAAVIAAGFATNQAGADSFLNAYVPSGISVTGTFAGSANLLPERGNSWTVGGVLQPRFLKGFSASVDYVNVEVRDTIVPTGAAQAIQLCYDSPNFPDTSADFGVNVCNFFSRVPQGQNRQFEVDNGFNAGFINLGAIRVEGINGVLEYTANLDDIFGEGAGRLNLYGNAYHLITYLSAPDNDFSTGQQSAGSFTRPKWRTQLRGRYENGGFYGQWVWNWQDKTALFQSGALVPGTNLSNEVQDFIKFPAWSIHSATIGYTFGEDRRFGVQLAVQNVFDKLYVGTEAQAYNFGTQIDNIGRRFVFSVNFRY